MNLFAIAVLLLAPAFAEVKLSRYACAEAKELQSDFLLTLTGNGAVFDIPFSYSRCQESSYTERFYTGREGYELSVVTNKGESRSHVLLAQNKAWIGNFGSALNAQLASGAAVSLGEAAIKNPIVGLIKAQASLRSMPAAPTAACDAAMSKYAPGASLMLLTSTQAFYYHEDCDICAQVDRCDIKTSQVTTLITAHSIRCEDLAPYVKGQVIVKDCR